LAWGACETNTAIAKQKGPAGMTVSKWRKRYRSFSLEGLHDDARRGGLRTHEDDKLAEAISRALQTEPTQASTRWCGPWRV
jgi:hypothetical protein